MAEEKISHSYPHCWRCKSPVIFRATEQWFISMKANDLHKKTLENIQKVNWVPTWGKDRILGMMENRPDWCISRQRAWGVPIIAFTCTKCNELLLDQKVVDHVADIVEKEGAMPGSSGPHRNFFLPARYARSAAAKNLPRRWISLTYGSIPA